MEELDGLRRLWAERFATWSEYGFPEPDSVFEPLTMWLDGSSHRHISHACFRGGQDSEPITVTFTDLLALPQDRLCPECCDQYHAARHPLLNAAVEAASDVLLVEEVLSADPSTLSPRDRWTLTGRALYSLSRLALRDDYHEFYRTSRGEDGDGEARAIRRDRWESWLEDHASRLNEQLSAWRTKAGTTEANAALLSRQDRDALLYGREVTWNKSQDLHLVFTNVDIADKWKSHVPPGLLQHLRYDDVWWWIAMATDPHTLFVHPADRDGCTTWVFLRVPSKVLRAFSPAPEERDRWITEIGPARRADPDDLYEQMWDILSVCRNPARPIIAGKRLLSAARHLSVCDLTGDEHDDMVEAAAASIAEYLHESPKKFLIHRPVKPVVTTVAPRSMAPRPRWLSLERPAMPRSKRLHDVHTFSDLGFDVGELAGHRIGLWCPDSETGLLHADRRCLRYEQISRVTVTATVTVRCCWCMLDVTLCRSQDDPMTTAFLVALHAQRIATDAAVLAAEVENPCGWDWQADHRIHRLRARLAYLVDPATGDPDIDRWTNEQAAVATAAVADAVRAVQACWSSGDQQRRLFAAVGDTLLDMNDAECHDVVRRWAESSHPDQQTSEETIAEVSTALCEYAASRGELWLTHMSGVVNYRIADSIINWWGAHRVTSGDRVDSWLVLPEPAARLLNALAPGVVQPVRVVPAGTTTADLPHLSEAT